VVKNKRCPNCGRYRAREHGFFTKSLKCGYCGASSTLLRREVKKTGLFFQRVESVKNIYDTKGGEKWARDWRTARDKALTRAGHRCSRCGATEKLHVHHIKPVSRGGTDALSNLTVLCATCHRAEHRRNGGTSCLQIIVGMGILLLILSVCASLAG
jgi:hypothetical protein